jgi:hypothetical protein
MLIGFVDLIEQLSAYTPNPDHLSYTTRFVDGLRDDIRAIILIQRPKDLDSVCTLALLQEEVVEPSRRRKVRRMDGFQFIKAPAPKGPMPLPPPLVWAGVPLVPADTKPQDDRRPPPRASTLEDKFQSLRSYGKVRGLCIRCGERWQPGHKCAPVMQLYMLQEVWNLCQDAFELPECSDAEAATPATDEETATAQLFLLLSAAASCSKSSARTMQFTGSIEGHDILMLVDSGSSHSFINSSVATRLSGVCALPAVVAVQVADGSSVPCSQEIPTAVCSADLRGARGLQPPLMT